MQRRVTIWQKRVLNYLLAWVVLAPISVADASTYSVQYAFNGGRAGYSPQSSLIGDAAGNLYGTTYYGGNYNCDYQYGCGTVFMVTPKGNGRILHRFWGGKYGKHPIAGLFRDASGNLYGTTIEGGIGSGCPVGEYDCGTVFKIAPDGTESVLYSFAGGSDGIFPQAGLVADKNGNLYGTTLLGGGGTGCSDGTSGCGTLFELSPDGRETVLYAFSGGSDGAFPMAGLLLDKAGNLYGTTQIGGSLNLGTVFERTAAGSVSVLHKFTGGGDGSWPEGPLIADKQGNLYGTTYHGGSASCGDPNGCGTVYEVKPDGTEMVLLSFSGTKDGAYSQGSLVMDGTGTIYGAIQQGGSYGRGSIFQLAPDGTETVLHFFAGGNDGMIPEAGLTRVGGKHLILVGTTAAGGGSGCYGGYGCGTAFQLTK